MKCKKGGDCDCRYTITMAICKKCGQIEELDQVLQGMGGDLYEQS